MYLILVKYALFLFYIILCGLVFILMIICDFSYSSIYSIKHAIIKNK